MTSLKNNDDEEASTSKLLIFMGGILIFCGIAFFLSHNWDLLAGVVRVFVTLGVAILSFVVGCSLSRNDQNLPASMVFFILSSILFPTGLATTLNFFGLMGNQELANVVISGICVLIFLPAAIHYQRTILLLISIIFGSLLMVATASFVADQFYGISYREYTLEHCEAVAVGLYYVLIGYIFSRLRNNILVGFLYCFGSFFILVGSCGLAGLGLMFPEHAYFFWQIATPILIVLCILLAYPMRSRSMVTLGMGFLIYYLLCVEEQYAHLFGRIGWPLILMGAGLGLIVLGYAVASLQKNIPKR
jgi:hypothetical protein